MVKVKQAKHSVKTYGKKKCKERKDTRPIFINSVTNVFHVTKNYFISKSSSGDAFDKLLKETSCNHACNNPSTSRSSPYGRFFQRQERSTFYHSEATSEKSSSMHLFKDPMDSNSFSFSYIPTPPSYYTKNKKLVRVKKTTIKAIDKVSRKRVKCPKIKRLSSSPHLKKSASASSSTPNRPHLVVHGGDWWSVNVSPILPPEITSSPSQDHKLLAIEGSVDTPSRRNRDMSALAAVLGRMELASSPDKNTTDIGSGHQENEYSSKQINETEHEPMQNEEYESPIVVGLQHSLMKNMSRNSFKRTECGDSPCEEQKESMQAKHGYEDSSYSKIDFVVDNSPTKNHPSDGSMANERDSNSMKKNFGESPSNNSTDANLRKSESVENIEKLEDNLIDKENCSCWDENEKTHSTMQNVKKYSPGNHDINYSVVKDDSMEEKREKDDSVMKHNRLSLHMEEKREKDDSVMKHNRLSLRMEEKREKDDSVMKHNRLSLRMEEKREKDDSVMKHNRLSLQPGKHWKRSLLQFRQEENRKSSVSSVFLSQKRKTIGPIILAKLIKKEARHSSLDCSKAINESLEETLPILRSESAQSSITKRRGFKRYQPLDLLQEEENFECSLSFNKSLRENAEKEYHRASIDLFENAEKEYHRASIDLFEEEEEFEHDDFLCSGVSKLNSADLDHLNSEHGASNFLIDNVEECPVEDVKLGTLAHCQQERPLPFTEVFPESILNNCKKIGEGVFGEVFMLRRSEHDISVVKIIPVEGTQLVNNEPQKHLDEVLSEIIISGELSSLRNNSENCTSGFCELKNKFCLQGVYPSRLVELWEKFAAEEKSENDCPDLFGCDQLYIALELDHAGQPVESYKFDTAKQAFSVFLQTTFSLAIAELSLEFEHRDLHVGNVLIKNTSEDYLPYILNGSVFQLPTFGVKATIIDFTLSRISFEGDVLFCDLAKDPELFTAEGDYQFEIYRLMRDDLKNNWRMHAPITNVRWLDYLMDKLITKKGYKKKKSNDHKQFMKRLNKLKELILDFWSSVDFSEYLLETYGETIDIIRVP